MTLADNNKIVAGTILSTTKFWPGYVTATKFPKRQISLLLPVISRTKFGMIYWNTCIALTGCRDNNSKKNIVDTFGFTQYATEATRNINILDLFFFCSSLYSIDSVTCNPGISDHLAVVASIKHEIKRPKPNQPRRGIFLRQGEYSATSQKLFSPLPVFDCHRENADVS